MQLTSHRQWAGICVGVLGCLLAISTAFAEQLRYEGQGLTVVVATNDDGSATGTITRGDSRFPFTGKVKGPLVTGKFTAGASKFDFKMQGFPSPVVDFSTGKKRYVINRIDPEGHQVIPDVVTLKRETVTDKLSGLPAVTILKPDYWMMKPEIKWQLEATVPASNKSVLVDLRNAAILNFMPIDTFFVWPEGVQFYKARGMQVPLENGAEVISSMKDPKEFIRDIALKRYISKKAKFTVVGYKTLKDLGKAHDQIVTELADREEKLDAKRLRVSAGRMHLRIDDGDIAMEAYIYCTLVSLEAVEIFPMLQQRGLANRPPTVVWPVYLVGFVAPAGKLDKLEPLVLSIAMSATPTIDFSQLVSGLQANKKPQAALTEDEVKTAAKKAIEKKSTDDWKAMQKATENGCRTYAKLSGKVKVVSEGNNMFVVAPTGCTVWTDGKGQYKFAREPEYKPKGDGWKKLQ